MNFSNYRKIRKLAKYESNLKQIYKKDPSTGNGACDRGFCRCHAGFVGSDCSQSVTSSRGGIDGRSAPPSAPPVVALAGKGLCDVRASPCRDLVILGDGFVSHESFQCSFEVYQVG